MDESVASTSAYEAESPFLSHRDRLDSYRAARQRGLDDLDVATAIAQLDQRIADVTGSGLRPTRFGPQPMLGAAIGWHGDLWIKDETANVSGSHKIRHLFGVAIEHALGEPAEGPYVIASCGNAALAASIVARAAEHALEIFVPTWADPDVIRSMVANGATVLRCARDPEEVGDPTHKAMLMAVEAGAVAFSCQSESTPATIDGGRTLAWEMIDSLLELGHPARIDHLIVQVGGGALGSSLARGLHDEVEAGRLAAFPRFHAVQPVGNHPLVRAWDRLMSAEDGAAPSNTLRARDALKRGPLSEDEAVALRARIDADPDRYMEPWDTEPTSYATGILDDVAYDWIPVVMAMATSGGWPLVAEEADFIQAHGLGQTHTRIPVSPTGAAGLAGLLALQRAGLAMPTTDERVALIFSGAQRAGDPPALTQ